MILYNSLIELPLNKINQLNFGRKIENLVWAIQNGFSNFIKPIHVITPSECKEILTLQKIPNKTIEDLQQLERKDREYFVRSSAICEDNIQIPTAGLFLTLGKISSKNLKKSILDCVNYFKKEKIAKIIGMRPLFSIFIQEMVYSKKSGVIFTMNPLNQDFSTIIIESSYGLGETVVSGKFPVDYFEIDKKIIEELEIREKSRKQINYIKKSLISDKKHFISEITNKKESVISSLQKETSITPYEISKLCEIAIRLEKKKKFPLDIEWAIDKQSKIWIMQIREAI